MTDRASAAPKRKLGRFEVLERLGEGGMGQVFRARDSDLDREVALKVLPPELAQDADRLARLRREAQLLASINHPNVAGLYAYEEVGGERYLVLESVPGETLARLLERGPLPLSTAVEIFRQIAAGLDAAHRRGIVHRDLKPSNVQITPDQTAKLLDFGLAKESGPEGSIDDLADARTVTDLVTEPGVVLGTAPYMSPEQARGQAINRQTDIWSFGCCLFEALTGKRAFAGDTASDIIADVLRGEPDWQALPEDTPRDIVRLLRRCLAKDCLNRQRDAGDLWLDLQTSAEEANAPSAGGPAEGGHAADERSARDPTRERQLRRRPIMTWTLAALVIILAVLWSIDRVRRERSGDVTTTVEGASSLPSDDGQEGVITFRLDRRQLETALEAQEPSEVDLRDSDILLVVPALSGSVETADSREPPPG